MKRIVVCDSRRVFVPANKALTQFFHASEATLLVLTTDQDILVKVGRRENSLRGGESLSIDAGNGRTLDLSAIELHAGERKAEVNIMFSYPYELSAVDLLADLAR